MNLTSNELKNLVDQMNIILEDYKKKGEESYLILYVVGAEGFYQQSTDLKNIVKFEIVPDSTTFIKIYYAGDQISFKNVKQVFEFFFTVNPKSEDPPVEVDPMYIS